MELRHLRLFVCLAEELDVLRAAKRCELSASVLRRHIADLEESLGCSLFRRHGATVSLSAAGQVFLQRARDLLVSADSAMGEARATAEASMKVLRVGHYGPWWLKRYASGLQRFSGMHPEVRLEPAQYLHGELSEKLRRGDIDLALLEHVDVGLRIDFQIRRIETIPSVIVMAAHHPLARRRKLSLRQLGEAVWVVWDERFYPGRRHLLLEAAQAARILPCIAWDSDNEESMFEQVSSGSAVGYAPDIIESLPEGVKAVQLRPGSIEFPVFLAWRRDSDDVSRHEALAECLMGRT